MNNFIKVTYDTLVSKADIQAFLRTVNRKPLLAFDIEARSIYTPKDRDEAKELLKTNLAGDYRQLCHVVAESSGLSYPEIIKTTHFVFSESESHSTLLVTDDPNMELCIWYSLANYRGKLLIHNPCFDLKVMYQRTGMLPRDFEDTQAMAKCLTNHVDIWKAKTGLKELMAAYYHPGWGMVEDYEPEDLLDPKFLLYSATDGAATYKLHKMCLGYFDES